VDQVGTVNQCRFERGVQANLASLVRIATSSASCHDVMMTQYFLCLDRE
jgi:hypothetical protein